MLLQPDDSSEGISRAELEQFWGQELTGLTMNQRRIIIELYRKSKKQAMSQSEAQKAVTDAE